MGNSKEVDIKDIIEFNNRFKVKLYTNLIQPSYVHGYSLGIEIIHKWFIETFKDPNYFKTVHIAGKNIYDDFRRFEYGELVKRIKPALAIIPSIMFDEDRDTLDMSRGGAELYVKRSKHERAFLKDPKKDIFLGINMELMVMNFVFRMKVATRAQQVDLFNKLKIFFRIGETRTKYLDMDFHIPYTIISNIAKDAGYEVDESGIIKEPYEVLKYLNQHSQIPILYKMRYINSKREYFLRMKDMAVHISTKDKLSPDDGEQEGHTMNNFTIDMNVGLRLPVPQFYVYFSQNPLSYTLDTDNPNNTMSMYGIKVIDIPEINDKGWVQYATSNYLPEKDEKFVDEIDISTLFVAPVGQEVNISLEDLISESLSNFISPSAFIDIGVYTNDLRIPGRIPIKMDWEHRKILFKERQIPSLLYISIYTDRDYTNNKSIEIDKMYEGRLK